MDSIVNTTVDSHTVDSIVNATTTTFQQHVENAAKTVPLNAPITVDDLTGRMVYNENYAPIRDHHHGQRKLLVEEVNALTKWNPPAGSVIVYAGAAPGDKNAYLANLFPQVRLICVDPAPFNVKPVDGVTIDSIDNVRKMGLDGMRDLIMRVYANATQVFTIQDYMTCDLAAAITDATAQNNASLYFISDIRTERRSNTGKSEPTSVDIMWNHSQQYNWYRIMKPVATMFKFRLPFYNEPVEWIESEIAKSSIIRASFAKSLEYGLDFRNMISTRTFRYPQGTLFVQAWAPKTSAETRLSIVGCGVSAPIITYMDMAEYEEKMFHYNLCTRMFTIAVNPNASKLDGFDNCCDCAIENAMWTDYIKLTNGGGVGINGVNKTVNDYVNELSRLLDKSLLRGGHGRYFEQMPLETAQALAAAKYSRGPKRSDGKKPNKNNNRYKNNGNNGNRGNEGRNNRKSDDVLRRAINGPK